MGQGQIQTLVHRVWLVPMPSKHRKWQLTHIKSHLSIEIDKEISSITGRSKDHEDRQNNYNPRFPPNDITSPDLPFYRRQNNKRENIL